MKSNFLRFQGLYVLMANLLPKLTCAAMLAGAFGSCSHPTPPAAPDAVTVSGPKSGVLRVPYKFTASINFTSGAALIYKWVFADTTISGMADSVTRAFKDTSKQIFSVHVIRTGDNAELCAASDTITIIDTTTPPPNPNDTTSHNFTWTEYTNVMGQNNMTGCWVFAPNDIYTLNQDLYHFDGNGWTQATLGGHAPGALSGASIFGFTHNDFWIIDGSIMYHWNGSTVIETRLENTGVWHYPQDGIIHSAWGTSSSDMYFVGDSGTILHFDGSNWTKMNSGTTKQLNSISGTSDNDIWASGLNFQTGESELVHYNGSSWSEIDLNTIGSFGPGDDGLSGVWTIDSAGHSIVYVMGSHVWKRVDNGLWSSDSGKVGNSLGGGQYIGVYTASGNSANDILFSGSSGLITHWNGKSWYRYDTLFAPGDVSFGTEGFSMRSNIACAVGSKDGTSWIAVGRRQ